MTSFNDVIDLALVTVDDYKLVKLMQQSEEEFLEYCDGFLIRAIPNFFQCRQSLDYDLNNRVFNSDLTSIEISILADFWAIEWLTKEVQNSAQFQLKLKVNNAFTFNSEAQNLKEKTSWLDRLRERVWQKIVDYQVSDLSDFAY